MVNIKTIAINNLKRDKVKTTTASEMWIFLLTTAREPGAGWSLRLISADVFWHAPPIKVLVWGLRPCCPACSFPSSWVAAYCFHHLRKQSLPVFLLLSPGCIWFFIVLFLSETFARFWITSFLYGLFVCFGCMVRFLDRLWPLCKEGRLYALCTVLSYKEKRLVSE